METTCADSWSDMAQPCDMDLWVIKWRSAWLRFHGPVILPYILIYVYCTFGVWISMTEVWPKKCRSQWPIFHGPVIVPYTLKTISCMNVIIWDYESVWPDAWPQNKCRTLWPIFHGPVILCYTLKTIWCMNIILGIMGLYDRTFHLKINVCHCDLYFMVHQFCLISQRLFDGWVSYFQIMRQCDTKFDLKINIGEHGLYSMV